MLSEERKLRTFDIDSPEYLFYKEMHENQCLELSKAKINHYKSNNTAKMSIKKALAMLDDFVDPSDPDLDVPNSIHAYQTAERIRKLYPNNKELQIIGLIHDVGKVLFSFGEPNWAVVGDTYILGCEYPHSIVYFDTLQKSPDYGKYKGNGIYKENYGLDNVVVSFGHDEYLYLVLQKNRKIHTLSKESMDIIRYHSLYPWHTGGAYRNLMNEKDGDYKTLQNVLEFNKFDLYSKEDPIEITDDVKQYYDDLLDEFFMDELIW